MALEIFLHGHGGWKPENGYTSVPRNTSVSFYTHFAKLLNATMAYPVLKNTFGKDPERTIGEFRQCPDMMLSSLTAVQHQKATNMFDGSGDRRLYMLNPAPPVQRFPLSVLIKVWRDAVADDQELNFHWAACQSLGLTQVGGRALGLNASDRSVQPGKEGKYLFKWTDENGVAQQKWADSTSTHNRV